MYSIDYRRRAVEYRKEGHGFGDLLEAFKIHPPTYYRWEREYQNGFPQPEDPQERAGGKIDKEALRRAVEEKPDSYLHELAEPFGCSAAAVYYMLKKMGITLKKRHSPIRKGRKESGRNT